MKQYYRKEDTPLAYHKFTWYVSLPIGFLVAMGRVIFGVSQMLFFNWLFAVDICYFTIAMTLILVSFVGFFGWKSYAWYSLMAYFCVGVAYSLYTVIVYTLYIPDQIGLVIGQIMGNLIYFILVSIYYGKRRPLFFLGTSYDVAPSYKYCRKCGFELLPESSFCSRCGTSVVTE